MIPQRASVPWFSSALGFLFGLPAFAIGPAGDDWYYAAPLFAFPWKALVPQGIFWRPLDHIVYWLAGFAHGWHVEACHLAAVLGHAASLAALCVLLREIGISRVVTLIAAAFVAVHPANAAAVWSVDSNHQTWSTAFGLSACILAMRGRRWVWLVPAMIAALWKESGLAWFAAAPALRLTVGAYYNIEPSGLVARVWTERRWLVLGLVGALAYLSARMLLAGQVMLGATEGRYAFSPNPLVWLRNAAMLLGVALIPVDTVAIFGIGHRLARGVAPAFLALPFGVMALFGLGRRRRVRPVCLLFGGLMLVAVMAPHLLIGHVSEMYAHPITFTLTVVASLLLGTSWPKCSTRLTQFAIALVLVAFVLVDLGKYREMLATARRAEIFAEQNRALLSPAQDRGVCFVPDDNQEWAGGYSVFQMDTASASGWGKAMVLQWGWGRYDAITVVASPAECTPGTLRLHLARDGTLRPAN